MAISAPGPERTSEGTNPVLIVAGTLLAVVLASVLIFAVGGNGARDAGGGGANLAGAAQGGGPCGQGTIADPSYAVDLVATPNPARPEGTTFLITPRHDGKPVAGAKLCLTADMPEMQHPSIDADARESSPGRYEARMQFSMAGTWRTWVTIAEPNKTPVSVALSVPVAQPDAS